MRKLYYSEIPTPAAATASRFNIKPKGKGFVKLVAVSGLYTNGAVASSPQITLQRLNGDGEAMFRQGDAAAGTVAVAISGGIGLQHGPYAAGLINMQAGGVSSINLPDVWWDCEVEVTITSTSLVGAALSNLSLWVSYAPSETED